MRHKQTALIVYFTVEHADNGEHVPQADGGGAALAAGIRRRPYSLRGQFNADIGDSLRQRLIEDDASGAALIVQQNLDAAVTAGTIRIC